MKEYSAMKSSNNADHRRLRFPKTAIVGVRANGPNGRCKASVSISSTPFTVVHMSASFLRPSGLASLHGKLPGSPDVPTTVAYTY